MIIPSESRSPERTQHYTQMGGSEVWARHMTYFEDVTNDLLPLLPSDTIASISDFIEEEERTLGKAETNSKWNNKANVRNGFWTDVPGMIGEIIASANLFTKYKNISHPQDKYTQFTQKIDIIATTNNLWLDDISVQVKVVRLEGNKIWIDPNWVEGEATHVSIIDITDQEHWCIERNILHGHVDEYLTDKKLENISTHYWYNFKKYPRG